MADQAYDPMADEIDNLALLGEDDGEEAAALPDKAEGAVSVPSMTDSSWTEYVMKQFQEYELFDGYPTCDGLRRVAALLLGPIVSLRSRSVQAPNSGNGMAATVETEVIFMWTQDEDMSPHQRIFSDVADVSNLNTEDPFCLHASACAATKAEGRALRKALMLSRVHSAEEMMDVPEDTGDAGRKITDSQFTFVNMMASNLDINALKMFEMTMKKNGYAVARDIPYKKAVEIFHWLNQCQTNTRKIPDELRGYDPEWREKLGVK